MPRFAANLTMLFNEQPFLERFGAARAQGFDGVEFLFPYAYPAAEIGARLAAQQLELVLFNLPCGDWAAGDRGLAVDPARRGAFQDSVGLALDYARALGATRLHCMAGIVPPGLHPDAAAACYIDNLGFAARACAAHGISLLIEPINRFNMPGYFLQSSAQAMAILAAVGAPNLRLQYDIYHAQRSEGELANTIAALLPHIGHMQLADTPGRHEPGTGEIAYRFLFQHIDALGYTGWIGCEYRPRADTVSGLRWRFDLTQ
ncbi:2-oxo-tetronate isomerase [Massilia sp. TS11]|uniref:2-oxo-tetronate isomerase n=1 Tax=Massilia sp. TS11 TaxID=2908003 RepID=UPI001EDB690D|nr:2-oxo-tetronate isomerase [Massilia sp. TS11]MCG2584433.1 hydroxypyruvate isomerase [Massilia sp. TS11]